MALEFKKLSEVDLAAELAGSETVLVNQNSEIKQASVEVFNMGGGSEDSEGTETTTSSIRYTLSLPEGEYVSRLYNADTLEQVFEEDFKNSFKKGNVFYCNYDNINPESNGTDSLYMCVGYFYSGPDKYYRLGYIATGIQEVTTNMTEMFKFV